MIPKIIHYCWLSGDPYPDHIRHCIDSWKKYLPDYEFMLWDRERFPKGKSRWVDQAFSHRKYAFAADYIRLYALYHFGGIYLDCDVEVLRPFEPFLSLETMICWQREMPGLEVAAFGVAPHSEWVGRCLGRYENRSFICADGQFDIEVLPCIIENLLRFSGYELADVSSVDNAALIQGENSIPVFPPTFFSPKSYMTQEVLLTDETYCIHHFDGSWLRDTWYDKVDKFLHRVVPGMERRHFRAFAKRFRALVYHLKGNESKS